MRDAVRDVAEQELLPPAHPRVPDDEYVGRLLLGRADDRPGHVGVDSEDRSRRRVRIRIRAQGPLRPVLGFREHLEENELAVEPPREIGGPRDRVLRGLGPVGGDDDFHGTRSP